MTRTSQPPPVAQLAIHASEGAAADAPAAAPLATSVATLLTRHVLRDGELVLLILRPSLLFIPLSSLRFVAAVALLVTAAWMLDRHLPSARPVYLQLAILAAAARLMWAVLQWTSRLYVLTDLRIVAISGVFNISIFDCTLRKIARARLVQPTRERLLRLGTIEIIPHDEAAPTGLWQTISQPLQVHDQVQAAIRRSRQGGM